MKKSSWWWIIIIAIVVILLLVLSSQGILGAWWKVGKTSFGGKCTTTDGNFAAWEAGNCTDRTGTYAEYCLGNFSSLTGEKIAEYYCKRNKCTMELTGCPPYKVCVNGGCYDRGNQTNSSG